LHSSQQIITAIIIIIIIQIIIPHMEPFSTLAQISAPCAPGRGGGGRAGGRQAL